MFQNVLASRLERNSFFVAEKALAKRVGVEGGKDAQILKMLQNAFPLSQNLWFAGS
ncbi:hypothetical protein D3C87_529690 [compost metagenome]